MSDLVGNPEDRFSDVAGQIPAGHLPLIFENIQTYSTSNRTDVRMPYLGYKFHLKWKSNKMSRFVRKLFLVFNDCATREIYDLGSRRIVLSM